MTEYMKYDRGSLHEMTADANAMTEGPYMKYDRGSLHEIGRDDPDEMTQGLHMECSRKT